MKTTLKLDNWEIKMLLMSMRYTIRKITFEKPIKTYIKLIKKLERIYKEVKNENL